MIANAPMASQTEKTVVNNQSPPPPETNNNEQLEIHKSPIADVKIVEETTNILPSETPELVEKPTTVINNDCNEQIPNNATNNTILTVVKKIFDPILKDKCHKKKKKEKDREKNENCKSSSNNNKVKEKHKDKTEVKLDTKKSSGEKLHKSNKNNVHSIERMNSGGSSTKKVSSSSKDKEKDKHKINSNGKHNNLDLDGKCVNEKDQLIDIKHTLLNGNIKEEQPQPQQHIKTRDDVAKQLKFNCEISTTNENATTNNHHINVIAIKSEPNDVKMMPSPTVINNTSTCPNVQLSNHNHNSTTSSSSRSNTSSTRKSSSSSSSSHHRHHNSSSSRDCSKCYKRSKIRRTNVGTQCVQPAPITTNVQLVDKTQRMMAPVGLEHLKYGHMFKIEVYPNGGASVVHLYQHDLESLTPEQMDELVNEFFEVCFAEDENGYAHHVMAIVHDSARYLPDLLEHLAENYSTLTVKAGVLGRNSDIETCTMSQYNEQVVRNYAQGTFRYGPLHQISLVGKVHEEVGGYFPDLLGRIEQNPFLRKVKII